MLPERYTASKVKKAIRNPSKVINEIERLSFFLSRPIINEWFQYKISNEEIPHIMKKDWDNLIILDACRYDFFVKNNTIEGDIKKAVSPASSSWGFLEHNFVNERYHNTVYITANPHAERLDDNTFFVYKNLLDCWDSDIETVHPKKIARAAVNAHRQYPNKRLLVHFMQPHTPWLGSTADDIRTRIDLKGYRNHPIPKKGEYRTGIKGFQAVKKGIISNQEAVDAYSESLDIVLEYVNKIIKEVDGKSVITSDHGEMLGERKAISPRLYGHFDDLSTAELRYVPWLEINSDKRRHIIDEEHKKNDGVDDKIREDRLRALGYK